MESNQSISKSVLALFPSEPVVDEVNVEVVECVIVVEGVEATVVVALIGYDFE